MPKQNPYKNSEIKPLTAEEEQKRLLAESESLISDEKSLLDDIDKLIEQAKEKGVDVSDIEKDIEDNSAGGHFELKGRERVWVEDKIKE